LSTPVIVDITGSDSDGEGGSYWSCQRDRCFEQWPPWCFRGTRPSNLFAAAGENAKTAKQWRNKHATTKYALARIAASVVSGRGFEDVIDPHCFDALKNTTHGTKGKAVPSGLPKKRKRAPDDQAAVDTTRKRFTKVQLAILACRCVDQALSGVAGRANQ